MTKQINDQINTMVLNEQQSHCLRKQTVTSANRCHNSQFVFLCSEFKTCGSNFNCGDERKSCVPLMWRCDGEKDCPNNADEEGCGE